MAAHSPHFLRALLLTGGALALTACANQSFLPKIFSRNADTERPEPVPINQVNNYQDGVEYPVRQPPMARRDGAPSAAGPAYAGGGTSAIKLRPDAPERYTVVRGDTLWDISGRFLRDPWLWPEIWQVNEQIANPHLIYPGDVLRLVWIDGQPRIVMDRGPLGDQRLSPQIRVQSLDRAIDTIPFDAIAGFLTRPTVFSRDEIDELPYIVDIKESHLVAGVGFTVYVRGTDAPAGTRMNVFHLGDVYRDPDNGRKLGREALYVGTGRILDAGDPARVLLTETVREALRGDRLTLEEVQDTANFFPRAPDVVVDGTIISVVDGVQLIGQYQVVVLNRGARDGLVPGHVLSVWQSGRMAIDRWENRGITGLLGPRKVELPEEQAGRLMIFRVRDDISYGLILVATSEIKVGDAVRNPR